MTKSNYISKSAFVWLDYSPTIPTQGHCKLGYAHFLERVSLVSRCLF